MVEWPYAGIAWGVLRGIRLPHPVGKAKGRTMDVKEIERYLRQQRIVLFALYGLAIIGVIFVIVFWPEWAAFWYLCRKARRTALRGRERPCQGGTSAICSRSQ